MRLSRVGFLSRTAAPAAFAGVGFVRFPAGAAEFAFKVSVDTAADHPLAVRAAEAAAAATQQSNGRLDVRLFPNNTLGGQDKIISEVRLGAVEMVLLGDSTTENSLPVVGITAIPFAFAGYKEAWSAMDGQLGKYLSAAITQESRTVRFSQAWEAGFRQLENSARPVHTAADARGLKIRVPESFVETSLWKSLGVSPTTVDSAQQYVALQTHLVDGTEVPLAVIAARKMWEVEKYVSLTNHMWTGYHLFAHAESMQALPKDLHDLMERTFSAGGRATRQDFVKLDDTLATQLKSQEWSSTRPIATRSKPLCMPPAPTPNGATTTEPRAGRYSSARSARCDRARIDQQEAEAAPKAHWSAGSGRAK